jgi:GT2 family glycosyltransferase
VRDPEQPPLVSIVVPVAGRRDVSRSPILLSLNKQYESGWELLFVGEAGIQRFGPTMSPDAADGAAVAEGLAGALNAAVEAARGTYVAFLDARSTLTPSAMTWIREFLTLNPSADVAYTDESTDSGRSVIRKPVFSPEWLRNQDYFGNLTLFRRSLVQSIGGFEAGLPGAEIYDLTLRATVRARSVERLSEILVATSGEGLRAAWPVDESVAAESTRAALARHLAETAGGTVREVRSSGIHDTRRQVEGEPLVSIIIPTRGDTAEVHGQSRCMVVEAVRSILALTTYRNYEFVIVIDDVAPAEVADDLIAVAGDRLRLVHWDRPFSFSEKMNLGVLHSRGEYLLFLNDDVEVISPEWLTALLALGQRPNAGMVGAMLYFEDDRIQHAGHAYYKLDVTHIGLDSERGAAGPNGAFLIEREVDGVTAACALLGRDVFFEVGGFSTRLPGNFNDVDLCMKITTRGYQNYWTPHAELYHYESKSRDPKVSTYELNTAWGRWEHLFYDSPHWPDDPHKLYRKPRSQR